MAKKYKYRKTFTHEGKRYAVYADTKVALGMKLTEKKAELESGRMTGRTSVQAYSESWLDIHKEPAVAQETLESVQGVVRHMVRVFGQKGLGEVTPGDCQKFLNEFNGMSYSLVSKIYIYTKEMFDDAIRDRLVRTNPMRGCRLPKYTKGSKRALTESERRIFLSACESCEFGLWGLYMYHCGVRPSETPRLLSNHIDLGQSLIYVDGTKTKAAKRYVPIPVAFEARLRQETESCKPFQPLFTSVHGKQATKTVYRRWWKLILAEMESLAESPWPGTLRQAA